jgi:hypothetical protein
MCHLVPGAHAGTRCITDSPPLLHKCHQQWACKSRRHSQQAPQPPCLSSAPAAAVLLSRWRGRGLRLLLHVRHTRCLISPGSRSHCLRCVRSGGSTSGSVWGCFWGRCRRRRCAGWGRWGWGCVWGHSCWRLGQCVGCLGAGLEEGLHVAGLEHHQRLGVDDPCLGNLAGYWGLCGASGSGRGGGGAKLNQPSGSGRAAVNH